MRIPDFTPPAGRTPVDFTPVGDAPLPPEMPAAVQATFCVAQALDRSLKRLDRQFGNLLKCQPPAEQTVEKLLAGGTAQNLVVEFVEQVQTKRIRQQMWAQQLRQCGAELTHCQQALPVESCRYLDARQAHILRDLQAMHPPPAEIAEAFEQTVNSSDDFFDKLIELIDLIKNGYLAGYEHIIAAYSDFFAEFNAEITAQLKDWIEGVNDGKEVKLNVGELRAALDKLIQKYSLPNPAAVLFPKPGEGGASREEAEKWLKALGLPASCLKQNFDGTYCVVIDIGPLLIMQHELPQGGTVTWDTARFQAWQAGFNAQEEQLKNRLQSLTQKYSNANAYHDNFNKTLSSHLSQYADMLKAMLNF